LVLILAILGANTHYRGDDRTVFKNKVPVRAEELAFEHLDDLEAGFTAKSMGYLNQAFLHP